MDLLTHLTLGAAIGEATLGNKIGRQAMLLGSLANTIPDIDVLTSLFFFGCATIYGTSWIYAFIFICGNYFTGIGLAL